MGKSSKYPVVQRVMLERTQAPETRRVLFETMEQLLGRPVLAFFTSFVYPVMIEPGDVDVIEGVLQKMDLSNGLAVVISSPGGSGLAAERLIRVCRSYSKTGEYWALVPSKAKSAATLACFGASKIMMSQTSELGPVDPQYATLGEEGVTVRYSVHNILKSYRELFSKAVQAKGNLDPYIQQLERFDARDIAEHQSSMDLSRDISVRALRTGMMKGLSYKSIAKKISAFLDPEQTKSHGRAIFADEAKEHGLNIDIQDVNSELWTTSAL